jgi:hypothetical protein
MWNQEVKFLARRGRVTAAGIRGHWCAFMGHSWFHHKGTKTLRPISTWTPFVALCLGGSKLTLNPEIFSTEFAEDAEQLALMLLFHQRNNATT